MRGGTIAGGAAATAAFGSQAAPQFSPVDRAAAALPLAPIAGGGFALTYLAQEAVDSYTGDSRDYSSYTGGEALHAEIHKGAVEMQSADERVMTGIENNIENSQNVALTKGKNAIIEEMNAGNPESDAQDAMQSAIDDYFSTIQENILTHWKEQARQIQHHASQVDAHEDLTTNDGNVFQQTQSGGGTFSVSDDTGSDGEAIYALINDNTGQSDYERRSIELLNGDEVDDVPVSSTSHGYTAPATGLDDVNYGDGYNAPLVTEDAESDDGAGYLISDRFNDAWDSLLAERDDVNGQLSGFVTDVYDNWEPDDIPTEDLVDPVTASTELRQDYDNMAAQGAHASLLGIPTTADQTMLLTVTDNDDEDWEVWADLYTDHVPEDADGEEVGFESGETYHPDEWDKPVYIAYDYVDADGNEQSDFTQIENQFTVELIEDSDGNEVDEPVQTRSRNNQSSDVDELQNELQALREDWVEMQEDAQEEDDGGSIVIGDLFDSGTGGIVGAIVGVFVLGGAIVGIGQATN